MTENDTPEPQWKLHDDCTASYGDLRIDLTDNRFAAQKNGEAVWRVIMTKPTLKKLLLAQEEKHRTVKLQTFINANRETIEQLLGFAKEDAEISPLLPGEKEIARLNPKLVREKEAVFLTDIHGNIDAFERTLRLLDLAESTEDGWKATQKGLATRLTIGGDINDRLPGFLRIAEVLLALKEQGMEVQWLWGDHELALLALACDAAGDHQSRFVTQSIEWLGKSAVSLQDIERYYVADHPEEVVATEEETAWLTARFYGNFREEMQRKLLMLRRTLREETSMPARYFANMKAMATADDVLSLHGLPGPYWTEVLRGGTKKQAVERANAHFEELLANPLVLQQIFFGEYLDILEYREDAEQLMANLHYENDCLHHKASSIIWRRCRTKDAPEWRKNFSLQEESASVLKEHGWAAIERGHDTEKQGPTSYNIHDIVIINGDGDMQKSATLACHVRILKDGRVAALREQADNLTS